MTKLLRYYAIASLACVLVAAVLLTAMYRSVSLETVVRMTERGNLALGQAVLNSVKAELLAYVDDASRAPPAGREASAFPRELEKEIRALMQDTTVVKVKIYSRHGTVVYSTQAGEIGDSQADNPGFIGAIGGTPVSEIVYRDTFNSFDRTTEEDNLLQTYIPIRASASDGVRGVFEIYTDVNPLLAQSERMLFIILGGAVLVLTMLYAALFLVVRRANRVIGAQQQTIRERTDRLEALTAQLLRNDESQRKRLALELHEGLAQTLSTIKLKVEMAAQAGASGSADAERPADSIVPLLAAAIEETRALASALRPSSLDDFGLLATITWFCREFRALHPDVQIEQRISIDENKVVAPLKLVIFRILESAMKTLANDMSAHRIYITLAADEGVIRLTIEAAPMRAMATVGDAMQADPASTFVDLHERTLQSAGKFSVVRNAMGAIVLSASWPR